MPYIYLTRNIILNANKDGIKDYGGRFAPPHNLLNDRLDYIVDMVQDDERYPDIDHKAAFYFVKILKGHMFNDGNKRTGLTAMLLFLELNGFQLKNNLQPSIFNGKIIPAQTAANSDIILENLANETASHDYDWEIEEIADFINKNKIAL